MHQAEEISQEEIFSAKEEISQEEISQEEISQEEISQEEISQKEISLEGISQEGISQEEISQEEDIRGASSDLGRYPPEDIRGYPPREKPDVRGRAVYLSSALSARCIPPMCQVPKQHLRRRRPFAVISP